MSAAKMTDCLIGICTGCGLMIQPGPYFRRRCKRHLNLLGHDAIEVTHCLE